jgi:TRAP-type C4-dicarboxylate transport system substrate-binding protein
MTGRVPNRWILVFALLASVPVSAQSLKIRLGTIAPEKSPWVDALKSMGQVWKKETGGRVDLTLKAVTNSSETSIILRMSSAGLEGAALSVIGLAEIEEAFNVLAIPFFFESDAELRHVLGKLTPMLKDRLEAKRCRLVLWGHAGWVQIFSKMPIGSIADLQRAKLFTSEGNPKVVNWYTTNGFHAVPLDAAEIPRQLKLPIGAIDAAPSTPPYALSLQFYRDAPYMLNLRVAPLVAGVVLTETAWSRLQPEDRTRMLDIARRTEDRLFDEAPNLDAAHIKEMQKSVLKVVTLDPLRAAEFRAKADELAASQSGSLIPEDVYQLAVREREVYRKSRARK